MIVRRLTFALVLVVVAWWSVPRLYTAGQAWLREQSQRRLDDAIGSTAYRMDGQGWLEFNVPAQAMAIRVLTNAAVRNRQPPPVTVEQPRPGWRYALDYELRKDDGQLLEGRRYHLRTRIGKSLPSETDRYEDRIWIRGSELLPTLARTVQLPLAGLSDTPKRLRLRVAVQEPQIDEILVRVYVRHTRPEHNRSYAWSRLSAERREQLCRALVYPPDLMSPWERRNLLRWTWSALPPLGRAGDDYFVRRIYQSEQLKDESSDPDLPESEETYLAGRPIAFHVPDLAGRVLLRIAPLESFPSTSVDASYLHLSWQRAHFPIRTWKVPLKSSPTPISMELRGGGLIELNADRPANLQLSWHSSASEDLDSDSQLPDGSMPLEAAYESLRTHRADALGSLQYTITHEGQEPAPVRVTLRRAAPTSANDLGRTLPTPLPKAIEPVTVNCQWLNDQGEVVRVVPLITSSVVSAYTRERQGAVALNVSEPMSCYFALPLGIARLRFVTAASDAAVVVSTRPAELPRTIIVPEPPENIGEGESRNWFYLQPDGFSERIAENLCIDLRLQHHVPMPLASQIVTQQIGDYLQPEGSYLGRFVLHRHDAGQPVRDTAWDVLYSELPIQKRTGITWRAAWPSDRIAPRLIYAASKQPTRPVQLTLNGSPYFRFMPRAACGDVQLPVITGSATGQRAQLIVSADPDVRIFIRNVEAKECDLYAKRFVYQLTERALRFPIVKHSDGIEWLSLRTFLGSRANEGAASNSSQLTNTYELNIRIHGIDQRIEGPMTSWTFSNRRYRIAAQTAVPAVLLDGTSWRADQGQRAGLVLGADLPAGAYQLEVSRSESLRNPVYLSLYQLLPSTAIQNAITTNRWITPKER